MNETSIPLTKAVVISLWTCSLLLLAASWLTWALGGGDVSILLGLTACVFAAAAATAHVRCYASRICNLMRFLNGSPIDGPLTTVRSLRD